MDWIFLIHWTLIKLSLKCFNSLHNPQFIKQIKFFSFKHSLSRRQQNIGKKTTTTKKFSISVICQIFLICWTIKLKFFFEHPFPRRQQKAKRCKAKQKKQEKNPKTYLLWNVKCKCKSWRKKYNTMRLWMNSSSCET
jgi:hypothetical protein